MDLDLEELAAVIELLDKSDFTDFRYEKGDLRIAVRRGGPPLTEERPAATARMGAPTDPMAVLDPQLRVKGVTGLRVVDASAMPKLPAVNPNITVMTMAEKCADLIRAG